MVFDVFHSRKKRKKQPELLRESEEPKRKVKDMETLKAGKLARLALELTGTLIKTHGPRPSGGKSALSAAEDLKQAYQSFCDEARCDDEHFHTQAIHIPLKLMPILYPVLLALLWCGLPLTATIIAVLFFAISYFQSFLYKPILERWTKSVDGKNVWATIRPKGRQDIPSFSRGIMTVLGFPHIPRRRSGNMRRTYCFPWRFVCFWWLNPWYSCLRKFLPENFWVSACLR
jgi:hypothetical protein